MPNKKDLKISSTIILILIFGTKSVAQIIPLDPIWQPFLVTPNKDIVPKLVFDGNNDIYSQESVVDSISKTLISNKVFKLNKAFQKVDSIDLLSLFPDKEQYVSMVLFQKKLELLNCHFVNGQTIKDFVATTIDLNLFQVESSSTFYLADSIFIFTSFPVMNSEGNWIMSYEKGLISGLFENGLIKFDKNGKVKSKQTWNSNNSTGSGPLIEQPDKSYVLSGSNRILFLDKNLDSTGLYVCGSVLNDASGSLRKGGISTDSSVVFLGFLHPFGYANGNIFYQDQSDRLVIIRDNKPKRFTYPLNIGFGYSPNFNSRTLTTDDQFVYFGANYYPAFDTCSFFSVISINKVDTLGNLIWQKKFGTNNFVSGSEYHTLPDGRIMMIFNKWYSQNQMLGLSGRDCYYLILDASGNPTTTTEMPFTEMPKKYVEIFPNPASDFVEVKNLTQKDEVEIRISDNLGSQILEKKLSTSSKIDLKSLSRGIYFIQILENGRIIQTEKLVKN